MKGFDKKTDSNDCEALQRQGEVMISEHAAESLRARCLGAAAVVPLMFAFRGRWATSLLAGVVATDTLVLAPTFESENKSLRDELAARVETCKQVAAFNKKRAG